jgi:hypothetical protein
MNITLLPLNVKNLNNIVYSDELMKDFRDEYMVELKTGGDFNDVDFGLICGKVIDIKIEDGKLVGEFGLLPSLPCGQLVQDFGIENFVIRPKGLGRWDEGTGIVSEYKLICFQAIRKEDDSFIEFQ